MAEKCGYSLIIRTSFVRRLISSLLIGRWIKKKEWVEISSKQLWKGLTKYGQCIDDCPKAKYNWDVMMIEELIDFWNYKLKNKSNV